MSIEIASELLDGGWIRVKVPLPNSLRYVNSYLVPEPDGGWTIIDTGMNTPQAREVWDRELSRSGIAAADIQRIVLTHQHPDHYGLAGWLQQRSGAPVWMTAEASRYARRLWGRGSSYTTELTEWFRRHGMPAELLAQLGPHQDSFLALVEPQPELTELPTGGTLALGGEMWEVLDAPGHAGGAVCLYSRASQTMVAGDQVLPRITPNISFVPGACEDPDPLYSYLESLRYLTGYTTKRVYPGHLDPFADLGERAREIILHHEHRLDNMRLLLRGGPISAFDLCELEFGSRIRLNIHNLRFAMSETLAHLVRLVRIGEAVQRESEENRWLFTSS